MAEPVRGRVRHRAAGRTRITLETPLPARGALQRLAEGLAEMHGVQSIEIRPTTGSLIVHHEGGFEPVERAATEARLIEFLPPEGAARPDVIRETLGRVSEMDEAVDRMSGGRVDLWSLAFLGLMGAGFIQLARGRVAGPAFTLFGQAATLAMARPVRKPKR